MSQQKIYAKREIGYKKQNLEQESCKKSWQRDRFCLSREVTAWEIGCLVALFIFFPVIIFL